MLRLSGAELTIRLLENQGVTHIAGIPGGFNLPLYDALGRRGTIRHILARHEQGAGFIAQGMARVTGRPGVIFATSGPGATNTLTALADARKARRAADRAAQDRLMDLLTEDQKKQLPSEDSLREDPWQAMMGGEDEE